MSLSHEAAAVRRAFRKQAEAAVAPHETEAAAIERQILKVEQRIAWVQRFGD